MAAVYGSGVARGGPGGPWPPKLLVNVFLCNEFMLLRSLNSRTVSLQKWRVICRSP